MVDTGPEALDGGRLVVVMADVRDPGNAGTVLRSADAAGADAVVCCGGTVDPYNPKTVRSSAGSIFHVPLVVLAERREALAAAGPARLPAPRGTWSGAGRTTRRSTGAGPPRSCSATRRPGCPATSALDGTVGIPMAGRAESLNVGVACAVLCFEALRQRRAGSCSDPCRMSRWTWPPIEREAAEAVAGRRRPPRTWPGSRRRSWASGRPLALAHRELGALAPDERREAGRRPPRGPGPPRGGGRPSGGPSWRRPSGRPPWPPTGST